MGAIDIVCNLFTEREVAEGRTGLDETFKAQIRMPAEMRGGVSVPRYLEKMDAAGIDRALLVAVRAGDLAVRRALERFYTGGEPVDETRARVLGECFAPNRTLACAYLLAGLKLNPE